MNMTKAKGVSAMGWFYGQSFTGGDRTPSANYVRRGIPMEETAVEVFAACGHPVEVRFHVDVTDIERRNGLAEVVGEPCSYCMDQINVGIQS
jgi:hypothetical protein